MSVNGFFTRLNPIISGVLRSPLHGLLSSGLLLLTVTRVLEYDRTQGLREDQLEALRHEVAAVRIQLESVAA